MRSGFKRSDRVAAELRREIGSLVHQAVRDGLLPQISVSDVEITRDLAYATVWFTALRNADAQPAEAMLKEQMRELRMQLARRVRLRITPELRFRYDPSMEQGERIEELLRDAGASDRADDVVGDDADIDSESGAASGPASSPAASSDEPTPTPAPDSGDDGPEGSR